MTHLPPALAALLLLSLVASTNRLLPTAILSQLTSPAFLNHGLECQLHDPLILILVSVHRFRVQRSRLGTRTKLKTRSPRKKCWFCHIFANAPPTFRLAMTKPGVSHINTPPKWSPGQERNLEPLNPWPRPTIGTIYTKSIV